MEGFSLMADNNNDDDRYDDDDDTVSYSGPSTDGPGGGAGRS